MTGTDVETRAVRTVDHTASWLTPRMAVGTVFYCFGAALGLWGGSVAEVARSSSIPAEIVGSAFVGFSAAGILGMIDPGYADQVLSLMDPGAADDIVNRIQSGQADMPAFQQKNVSTQLKRQLGVPA